MSKRFWLTDEQMDRLRPFFPKRHGNPRVGDRRVLSGIIFINRNGLRWCDAPREYGPPKTLYNRFFGCRPKCKRLSSLSGSDRVRTFFRPLGAALSEAAGRYGDQRIRS